MKKINVVITNNESTDMDSFDNVSVDIVKKITNGTCSEIICSILDQLNASSRIELINILTKKVENLGFITLKFINTTKICKDLIKGNSNSQYLSNIVENSKSLFVDSDMIDILSKIDNISIQKTYYDNIYSIIVLQKKL